MQRDSPIGLPDTLPRVGAAARRAAPADATARTWLVLVGTAYLAFVIYGSLVPLQFRPLSMDAALRAFKDIPYLALGIGSRADWAANLLLFIPLAFVWSGVVWPKKPGALRVLAGLAVGSACVALAVGIEFTQLFFPQRTVSINDIVAESVGGLLGVCAWSLWGERFRAWLLSLRLVSGTAGIAERLLMAYLFVKLGYDLLPLDLTLSPVELYHKWNEGRILVLPFGAHYQDRAHQVYDLLADIAVWIPVALLCKLAYRQPGATVWIYVVAAATVVELLQLFVYSRITDTTDIIAAAIAASVALPLVSRPPIRQRMAGPPARPAAAAGRGATLFALLIWLGVLATVFWYPFDFNIDRAFVRDRLLSLNRVPFHAYYFGSEFRAITEVLHKTGFMLPLGILLGRLVDSSAARWPRGLLHCAAIAVVVSVAVGIEFGQVFLPTKNVDITDGVLASVGGIAGYLGCLVVLARLDPARPDSGPGGRRARWP